MIDGTSDPSGPAPDIAELEAAMTQPGPSVSGTALTAPAAPTAPGAAPAAPGATPGWTAPGPQAAPAWSAPPPPAGGAGTKFCFACGTSIDARAEICPRCGVRQPYQAGMPGGRGLTSGDVTTRTGKSKLVASLLAIFLGVFGVHKFYLGDNSQGVIYLIFFWTAIPAVVGFIEGILWLVQSDQEWLARYGNR